MENINSAKSCKLCKVNFNSANDRTLHFLGKKHVKKEKEYKNFSCGVFVAGFGPSNRKEDLLQYFSKFGAITQTHVGPKLNYMILVFDKEEDAVAVINTRHIFDGKQLVVEKRNPSTKLEMAATGDPLDTNSITILRSLQEIPTLSEQLNMFLVEMTPNMQQIIPVYHKVNMDILKAMRSEFTYCQVHPFGSTTTSLQFNNSDIDIFVNIRDRPKDDIDCLKVAKKALHKSRIFRNIIGIPSAKIPIIKCVHNETGIRCDVNFTNMLGVKNSQLILYYLCMDPRLRPVMLAIKYWAKVQGLTGRNHLFSNYSMVMMFLFYLQREYLLPSVLFLQKHTVPTDSQFIWNANISQSGHNLNLDKLRAASHLSILKGFFAYYSDFPFATHIICPYLGEAINKQMFLQLNTIPEEFCVYKMVMESLEPLKIDRPLCLQDPFVHNFNACGAIFQNTLEKYVTLCKFAVEKILSYKNEKNMLYLLFTQRPEQNCSHIPASDPDNYLVCIRMKNQPRRLRDKVALKENDPNFKRELLKLWFDEAHNYVLTVLSRVYKAEIEEVDDSNSKNSRKDNQRDVRDCIDCKKYRVKCFMNLWDARNLSPPEIDDELSKCETTLDRNIVLSKYLWKKHINYMPSTPLFECEVNFSCLEEPAMVNIELIKISSYKKTYKSFCTHLLSKLPQGFVVNENELSLKL